MANETFDTLTDDLLIYLDAIPEPLAEKLIRSSVRDFCKWSTVWRQWIEFDADAYEDEFQLYLPSRSEIVAVHAVHDGDGFIAAADEDYPGVESDTKSNPDHDAGYLLVRPDRIKLVPTPTQDRKYRALVSLRPSPDATGCPDWILDEWREGIIYGALARAFEIPKKSWSDSGQATWNLKKFKQERTRARISVQKQGTTKSRQARPRSFF